MKTLLLPSILILVLVGIFLIPQANALPVSYNQTSLNFGFTSIPRNSSSYDVFTLDQDNWLWEKFDNNTIDSGPLSIAGTVTYNTNLQKYFSFNSVLTDTVNHGSMVVVGSTTYSTGQENNAFLFNGNTNMSSSGTGLVNGTGSRSVSFWLKTPASAPLTYSYLFAQGDGGLNSPFTLYLSSTYTLVSNSFGNDRTSSTVLSAGTWYYITEVLSNTGQTRDLYINGVEDSNFPYTSTAINTPTSKLYIGNAVWDVNHNLPNGSIIDEFRYYNTNLSLTQHKALYMVGHYSQSHTFDGGEYVSLGSTGTFNFEYNQPWTISSWIKTSSSSASNTIFSKNLGSGNGQGIYVYTNGGLIYVQIVSTVNVVGIEKRTTNTYNDGVYHYIAIDYSGSGTASGLTIYVDGTAVTTVTLLDNLAGNSIISAATPKIGNDSYLTDAFTGQLDNVKIYPYALSSSQVTTDMSLAPVSSGKQYMSWYNGVAGSSTLTQKLGSTKSSLSLACNLPTQLPYLVSNNTNIYYVCASSNIIHQIAIQSGTDTTYFKIAIPINGYNSNSNSYVLFKTIQNIVAFMADPSGAAARSATKSVNNTLTPSASSFSPVSNQKLGMSGYEIKYNTNSSTLSNSGFTTNPCEINYTPSTTEKSIDNIACDIANNPNAIKYWQGFNIQGTANYATNSTQQFLSSIDASAYKKLLSLPCIILVNESTCTTFIMTDYTNTDYFIVLTSTHVYYKNAQTALSYLLNHNYAFQSYDVITQSTTSAYEIQNPILQAMTLYGFNLNSTVNLAGLFTLPSGDSIRTTTVSPSIRLIDPRWTDDSTDIPIITSTQSLFPIFLTVSNAPVFSAIKVTTPLQIINGQEAVWAVAQLDSTRSVEFDLPSSVCVNIYVADISVSPSIWNFEGIICTTGVNQKTISYTNTLPFSFWSYPWGASDSFTPNTNGLVTTVRHTTTPFSYNLVLKNSTGSVFQNTTYTSNSTIDTQSFNLTGRAKPVSLYINSVTGGVNQIYSAFLGSPISLASTASFFNQYFSYQGFNLLTFIPVIFASMFTRNTIGIGVILTVLSIATLSWLSIVVIPELDIMIIMVIAIMGLIAYRLTYY